MSSRTPRLASTGQTSENKKTDGSPPRRRSARLSANEENVPSKSEARVKRSITVRKIAPRKTQVSIKVPSEPNKENGEILPSPKKRHEMSGQTQAEAPVPKSVILSPIKAAASPPSQIRGSEQDPVWSHKVRRSYSRLSMGDRSFESPKSPTRRETLFGFERLQTPEVMRQAKVSQRALQSTSLCVGSFNLSAADDSTCNQAEPEPDLNIPGVCLVKKSTRRKKVQQIKTPELDVLAAKMNAEFEEAECFELVVE